MDAISLALVLSAALIHATWNVLAKRAAGGARFVWCYSVASGVFYFPVLWLTAPAHAWSWGVAGVVVASGLLHLGYALVLQAGYQRADLSVVYPVARGTGPALSVIGAILLLGEPASLTTVGGAVLIVAGILVIGLHAGTGARRLLAGVRWGGLTGLFIAAYTVLDGAAVKLMAVAPIVLDYFGNLLRIGLLTPLALGGAPDWREEWRRYGGIALLCGALVPLSYIFVLFAMQRAPVSVVAPAREASMMVGVLLGWWLFKEGQLLRRLAGAALIGLGVVVLA
ncbi:MAG TPA: DMT family transporter [Burkholderiales bacterium]|nr:DMT family transporter [Burkholderiales bacterium]